MDWDSGQNKKHQQPHLPASWLQKQCDSCLTAVQPHLPQHDALSVCTPSNSGVLMSSFPELLLYGVFGLHVCVCFLQKQESKWGAAFLFQTAMCVLLILTKTNYIDLIDHIKFYPSSHSPLPLLNTCVHPPHTHTHIHTDICMEDSR